jgi:multidrug efflux pump
VLSRFFIDRPIFAAVLSVFIVIAGLASMRSLPIAQYPEIAPPVVTVRAVYPGASAEVIRPSPRRSNSRSTASRTCST